MAPEIALLDWDGTLRPGIMLLDWATFLEHGGLLRSASLAGMRRMAAAYRAGEAPYETFVVEVVDEYAAGIAGAAVDAVAVAARGFAEGDAASLFPMARPLLTVLRDVGLEVIVISGSPVEPLAAHFASLGISGLEATAVEVRDGAYTSRVLRNVARTPVKEAAVAGLAARGIAFAAGDRPIDASMVTLARLGACVAPPDAPLPAGFPADSIRLWPEMGEAEVRSALSGLFAP